MSDTTWAKPHYRNGCWVREHRRSNGALVKGHWRNGGNVSGHQVKPGTSATHGTPKNAAPHHARPKLPTILVQPAENLVALAIAIEQNRIARIRQKTRRHAAEGKALLEAVIYRDDDGRNRRVDGIPVATLTANLPAEVRQITLETTVEIGGDKKRYRLDTPVFFNSDGTLTQTGDANVDPDTANRILDRIRKNPSELQEARRHNQVRQRLGRHNPERAVSQAVHEMLRLNPLPRLNLSREFSIPVPGTNYSVIFRPSEAAASRKPPHAKAA